eukprot:3818013-Pleurochrysis_carterae.AAC.2
MCCVSLRCRARNVQFSCEQTGLRAFKSVGEMCKVAEQSTRKRGRYSQRTRSLRPACESDPTSPTRR